MPTYVYTVKSGPKNTIQGEIEAETEQEAVNKLTEMGYFPVSVLPKDLHLHKRDIFRFAKIPNRDIVLFTRQLSSLIESGVNIIHGLNIVSGQITNKYLKSILSDVISKIKDGKSLSDSLANHPYAFSGLYTSMIHSGEVGGTLNVTLSRLADFLEKEEEFKNSLRAALTYPVFVLFVGTMTIIVLLTFVIPRLVNMFEDIGQVLPLPTRILITVSGFLRHYWWILLAGIFMLAFALRRLYHSPQGKLVWDRFKLKLALIGQITLKAEIGRLSRTLSLLLSSGIPIMPSLEISASILGNAVLKNEVTRFREEIINGSSLSHTMKASKTFPEFVTNIVTIGEETGSLEKSLLRIADDYEREVDRSLKTLARMLEPIIILVVGLVVGFIVLSMLLPIFQINLIVR